MNKKQFELAVVIINYKTPQLVIDCLDSLRSELPALNTKVVVVDNASNDNSCELIQEWINKQTLSDHVSLLPSMDNTGFSGGNNLGIRYIDAEYYLLLNSDTLVREGAISSLLEAARDDSSVGLVSPRLEWPDATPQESCFRFHSPISELILSSNTGLITQLFNSFNVPYPISDNVGFYDWTSFACVLVRADVFKDIGLMDDGYFMYFEDVAFSYHAKQAGWKVLNFPAARVVHLRGGSSSVKSRTLLRKRLPRYYFESRTRYFYQVYGHIGLFWANILWTVGHGVALLRRCLSSAFVPTASAFQWRDIWINFFAPLKAYIHPDNYDKT